MAVLHISEKCIIKTNQNKTGKLKNDIYLAEKKEKKVDKNQFNHLKQQLIPIDSYPTHTKGCIKCIKLIWTAMKETLMNGKKILYIFD